jgi:hypothetical protein
LKIKGAKQRVAFAGAEQSTTTANFDNEQLPQQPMSSKTKLKAAHQLTNASTGLGATTMKTISKRFPDQMVRRLRMEEATLTIVMICDMLDSPAVLAQLEPDPSTFFESLGIWDALQPNPGAFRARNGVVWSTSSQRILLGGQHNPKWL